jgi:NADH:ubiquinone oxidoreductase subunit
MVIIEIIFVIICFFYLIRLSLPWIIRFLITRFIKKVSKDKNFNNFYQTNSSKTKNKKVNNPDKDVEYIDYEEID